MPNGYPPEEIPLEIFWPLLAVLIALIVIQDVVIRQRRKQNQSQNAQKPAFNARNRGE